MPKCYMQFFQLRVQVTHACFPSYLNEIGWTVFLFAHRIMSVIFAFVLGFF